jgi:hypothetical protein
VSELELEGGTVHVVQGIYVSSNYCKEEKADGVCSKAKCVGG